MAGLSRWLKPRAAGGGQTRKETRLAAAPGDGTPTGPITLRSGVVPGGDPFGLSGSGMTATVGVGRAVVQGTTAQGAYSVAFDVAQSLLIPDGNGVNPRIDLLVIRVYDPEIDGSPSAQVVLERVPGTPAASPVAPAAPAGSLALWEIPVTATNSAGNPINWASRTDRRQYTVSAGGIGVGPDSATGAHDAQYRDRGTTTGLERWNGGSAAWESRLYLGTSGRIVIGSDVELYRDAPNSLRTPDQLTVDGNLNVAGVGQRQFARVAVGAEQSVTNSTSLVDATGFSFPVVSGGVYVVRGLIGGTGSTVGDLKIGWLAPGASTFDWTPTMQPSSGSATVGSVITDRSTVAQSQQLGTIGTGTVMTALINGLLVAAAAGSFRMLIAQGTADATPSTLKAGSFIMVERVA
ncbi:hypothetical protein [Kitasatospora cheerisanensis]|uniref:Minor tail protein n=1 Tax=Kitasatospora cheerisanensis KCTC 2395 TaxID=1348663 RepID=A0A066YYW2_9ACTN|nr:hypothetical protein [Kitasatospora cheerisanensis]KDN86703.1 hypothetical protein KCH_15400 [Kitasatospora cheerisanensis KCTC 2395]